MYRNLISSIFQRSQLTVERYFIGSFSNLNLLSPKRQFMFNDNKDKKKYEESKRDFPVPIWTLSILTWLGFNSEDENKESELIITLKRAILCTKREQFKNAEQLMHIALRLAQQQQNEQGILYCYDLMANLAFEQQDLNKAEKLFKAVLQILLSNGIQQDDIRIIHISLKLARIYQLKAELDKAELGYQWCLEKIKNVMNQDKDFLILCGVVHDWYAQFLLDQDKVSEALVHLSQAFLICEKTLGHCNEESMLLLNDLGTTSFRAGNIRVAESYLLKGIDIGNNVDDQTHLGVLHANLGLILLHQGLFKEAEKYCKQAWHLGKQNDNPETKDHASYCFEQIKLNMES